MREAMALAQRGEGAVNPNPLVGAVIVRHAADGASEVIARGYHRRYGDLHAERDAFRLADADGTDCTGATMYVTLEPCCHHGHQPPCTEAIVDHRISRVVVGLPDPNPLVAGKGVEILRCAGIEVEMIGTTPEGEMLERELRDQNRVFLHYITTGRPWVVMKYAMTLDGKICTRTGDSRWVSGEVSRKRVHEMRRSLTAILCGIGTVLADDPMLNTRIEGVPEARNPIRIVADRTARLPLDCRLARTAREIPTIVVHTEEADPARLAELRALGVQTWCCRSVEEMLLRAGKEKIDGILLEGGGTLNETFLREGWINEVYAFVALKLVGGAEAKTPIEGMGLSSMAEALPLHDIRIERLGEDILIRGTISV